MAVRTHHIAPTAIPRTGTEVPWPEAVRDPVEQRPQVDGALDPPEAQRNVSASPEGKPPPLRGE